MSWLDWLRMQRAVWTLDAHLQSLPGRARKAIRGEMRANLRAATADVGPARAVAQLGDVRRIARGYLDAEYGENGPRPRWLRAVFWMLAVEIVVLLMFFTGYQGYEAGLLATNPRPDGTFAWTGLAWLGVSGDVTYADGRYTGGAMNFSLWLLAYLLTAGVLGGRLWRLIPSWWRHRSLRVR
jgi:hypothetical protein